MAGMWKEKLAKEIIDEAQRLNVREMIEPMWGWGTDGNIHVEGEDLPGFESEDVTAEELDKVATASADFELWWCRAIANKKNLSIPFIDWYWYSHSTEVADDAICSRENAQVCRHEEVLGN